MVYTFCFLEIQEKTRNTEKNKTNGFYLSLLYLSVLLKTSFPIVNFNVSWQPRMTLLH